MVREMWREEAAFDEALRLVRLESEAKEAEAQGCPGAKSAKSTLSTGGFT